MCYIFRYKCKCKFFSRTIITLLIKCIKPYVQADDLTLRKSWLQSYYPLHLKAGINDPLIMFFIYFWIKLDAAVCRSSSCCDFNWSKNCGIKLKLHIYTYSILKCTSLKNGLPIPLAITHKNIKEEDIRILISKNYGEMGSCAAVWHAHDLCWTYKIYSDFNTYFDLQSISSPILPPVVLKVNPKQIFIKAKEKLISNF